ncbi:MAG: proteasome and subunit [Chthoniobacteraceae bacterium]|nr:proteasome and subunit [Chthoniobacteraceae bacterium]
MIEEPYRWVEAIANRREYIEHQLGGGSPIVALNFKEGIVLFTLGRERQKLFEIYDRIAMGAIGHPGDIERLRMMALELASTEGFVRSGDDVSLRRLATYSLSSVLKTAFEQIYGAPYLARMLFVELGRGDSPNLFLRLEYDGAIHTNGGFGRAFEEFGVLSGNAFSTAQMTRFLQEQNFANVSLEKALRVALEAWAVGHLALGAEESMELPSSATIALHAEEQLTAASIEAAVLDRSASLPVTWRLLTDAALRPLLQSR